MDYVDWHEAMVTNRYRTPFVKGAMPNEISLWLGSLLRRFWPVPSYRLHAAQAEIYALRDELFRVTCFDKSDTAV